MQMSNMEVAIKNKKTRKPTIYSFPNEVIIIILENLSIYDRMSFGMTCRSFHNLFNSTPQLNRDKIVKIGKNNYDTFLTLFNTKISKQIIHIILTNIKFKNCKLCNFNEDFWCEYGKFVTSIAFEYCDINDNDLLRRIFCYCPNLQEFTLNNLDDYNNVTNLKIARENLNACSTLTYEKLRKIKVRYGLSDFSFNNFIANAPKLRSVVTKSIQFFDNKPEEDELHTNKKMKIELEENQVTQNLNTEKLTFNNIMQVLPSSSITSLCNKDLRFFPQVGKYFISPEIKYSAYSCAEIQNICKLKEFDFKLEELHIGFSQDEENDTHGYETLINTYGDCLKYLKIVTKSLESLIFEKPIIPAFNKLINLQTLIVVGQVLLDDSFMGLAHLKNLETLQFSVYPQYVFTYHRDDPSKVHDVLMQLPKLRRLHIKGAELPKFDTYLNHKTIGLIELHLENCIKIKIKQMFAALYENHKSLCKLSIISEKSFITDQHLSVKKIQNSLEEPAHIGISSLKNLKCLALVSTLISDKIIIEEFKWNELTTLNLNNNKNLTDASMLSLSKNCPALTELGLLSCKSITDEGVKYLSNLTRLRKIDLRCTKVTGVGIKCLIQSSCPLTECKIHERKLFSTGFRVETFINKLSHIY